MFRDPCTRAKDKNNVDERQSEAFAAGAMRRSDRGNLTSPISTELVRCCDGSSPSDDHDAGGRDASGGLDLTTG